MTSNARSRTRVVRTFLRDLKNSPWLGTARNWWPNYLFHFTDIRNAVSILKEGALLSRLQAQERNLMATDNANLDIIDNTDEAWQDFVRLYFRPRTPTQFRNEGIRPRDNLYRGAHCPVPVYFLFDAPTILSRPDCQFTDGNLASRPNVFSSPADLGQLPFESIYHDGGVTDADRRAVVFHRHAEVIIPKILNLNSLRYIACRTQAEYETLLYLLPASAVRRWADQIFLDRRWQFFFKRWVYLETVELSSSEAIFNFRRQPEYAGPFHAKATFTDTLTERLQPWTRDTLTANEPLELPLPKGGPFADYSIRLFLDDNIAYANRYQEDDLPW